MSSQNIITIKRKWLLIKIGEGILFGVGVGFISAFVLRLVGYPDLVLIGLASGLAFFIWLQISKVFKITNIEIARFLSKTYPVLQNSTELLLQNPNKLNKVEHIQKERIDTIINGLSISLPILWKLPIVTFLFGVVLYLFGDRYKTSHLKMTENLNQPIESVLMDSVRVAPSIHSLQIKITPPGYTKFKQSVQQTGDLSVLQGSRITWMLDVSNEIDAVNLVFANGDKYLLKKDEQFSVSYKAEFNNFYYFEMLHENGKINSELYALKVKMDEVPIIDLGTREAYQEFEFGSKHYDKIEAKVLDDFGVVSAVIIATVAKGSGESIKFREEEIAFDTFKYKDEKEVTYLKNLSLGRLGLEPGDELYFYVKAKDNKLPISNIAKSETYFIVLSDTSEVEFSLEGNLGVDLMPEYFRSQRQIIIETEKLIKSKTKLTAYEHNFTSNELGFDQKVLRLKYGQFMGEEFVTDAGDGAGEVVMETHTEDEDQLAEYTHAHDSENDHNLLEVNDKGAELGHSHDNAEENTYFSLSVRAKLKEAMAQMWDAELYLRLYQPKKSLPYQYKALKLIKEIKNQARIYVQRMGFDPPPIKVKESRFKGKALDDVISSRANNSLVIVDSFEKTKELLEEINSHFKSGKIIKASFWQNAGNELAPKAIEDPGRFFEELKQLKEFRNGAVTNYDQELKKVYQSLIDLLPPSTQFTQRKAARSKWDKIFLDQLNFEK